MNERYQVSCEYTYSFTFEGRQVEIDHKKTSGFKNKKKALERYETLKENPKNYFHSDNYKITKVIFRTIISEEYIF